MVTLNVKSDLDKFAAQLSELERRQVRYAASRALTEVAKAAVKDMQAEMPRIFDRPTRYTINAVYAIPNRDKRNLEAVVAIRNQASGTPQERYLSPEILGGPRATKAFETKIGLGQLVPAAGALLDANGNVQRAQINAILANLRAASTPASKAQLRRLEKRGRLTKTAKGMAKYFVAKSKQDGSILGIWNYLSPGHVAPVFLAAKRPPAYSERLPFEPFILASYARTFTPALQKWFAKAIATAKQGGGASL